MRQNLGKGQKSALVQTLGFYGQLPEFSLIDKKGKSFGLYDLKDNVWVADFIFTRCGGICPIMTQKMASLHEEFSQKDALRWVSVSVDPDWDTPERLLAYAQKYDADKEDWNFLTGKREPIHRLVKEGFKLGVAEGKSTEEPIIHSNRFVLVDKEGWIRGYYQATVDEELVKLRKDIRKLLSA